MGLRIGVAGCGAFGPGFASLFKAHPLVESVAVADLIEKRAIDTANNYGIDRIYRSLEEMVKSKDIDTIAIFTQRQLHGKHALLALENGKHVYSAVPMTSDIDDIPAIINTAEKNGLIYMTGETSYYYPCTIYCRKQYKAGTFGKIVFGEAQYYHDMQHFYESFKRSGGVNWKQIAGFPPMYYPTHSVSMIVGVTGERAEKVSCFGYKDDHDDNIFRAGENIWDNEFSNEYALMKMSDGSTARINECRRIGRFGADSVYMSIFGTLASYEQNALSNALTTIDGKGNIDLTKMLKCKNIDVDIDHDIDARYKDEFYYQGVSEVHDIGRLPKEFIGMHNGHSGSHQFLVDDFVKAVTQLRLPPNNAWNAAKYCAPGLIAHESAKKDGEVLNIPDFGSPDKKYQFITLS